MADDDSPKDADFKPTTGRFRRFAKLASLGARLSTEVASRGVKAMAGKAQESLIGAGAAEKLVDTLGDLKGLAMKLGQSLAMDPDLLTPEVRSVVARLQNQAPSMPWATVKQVVTQELGGTPEEKFAEFDQQPLAAASLGQVHRAVTKDGQAVAVKVQYPGIGKALESDLDNVESVFGVVSKALRVADARAYYEEARGELLKELDYVQEAVRAREFAEAVKEVGTLYVPRPFEDLSSGKVLTLELLPGRTLKEMLANLDEVPNEERFRVSTRLIDAIWGPFLSGGMIHSDPHPGNFVLMPNGMLGVLDFGSVKNSSEKWVHINRVMYGYVLDQTPMNPVQLSREAGFTINSTDEEARPFIDTVIELATEPIRFDDYDFGKANTNKLMQNFFIKNKLTMVTKIRPPPEGIMFYRALGGLVQNLQNIKARGNFRAHYQSLRRLYEGKI